jgi:hypothetical protein
MAGSGSTICPVKLDPFGGFGMRRREALQGVWTIAFPSISSGYEAAAFSQLEAAELVVVGEGVFRRWRRRFEDDGEAALLTGGHGRRQPGDAGTRPDDAGTIRMAHKNLGAKDGVHLNGGSAGGCATQYAADVVQTGIVPASADRRG